MSSDSLSISLPGVVAAIELNVCLHKFVNIELHNQGWYAVQVKILPDRSIPAVWLEHVKDESQPRESAASAARAPLFDMEKMVYRSKIFRIRYCLEEVHLGETVCFHIFCNNLQDLQQVNCDVEVELLFQETDIQNYDANPTSFNLRTISREVIRVARFVSGAAGHASIVFGSCNFSLVAAAIVSAFCGFTTLDCALGANHRHTLFSHGNKTYRAIWRPQLDMGAKSSNGLPSPPIVDVGCGCGPRQSGKNVAAPLRRTVSAENVEPMHDSAASQMVNGGSLVHDVVAGALYRGWETFLEGPVKGVSTSSAVLEKLRMERIGRLYSLQTDVRQRNRTALNAFLQSLPKELFHPQTVEGMRTLLTKSNTTIAEIKASKIDGSVSRRSSLALTELPLPSPKSLGNNLSASVGLPATPSPDHNHTQTPPHQLRSPSPSPNELSTTWGGTLGSQDNHLLPAPLERWDRMSPSRQAGPRASPTRRRGAPPSTMRPLKGLAGSVNVGGPRAGRVESLRMDAEGVRSLANSLRTTDRLDVVAAAQLLQELPSAAAFVAGLPEGYSTSDALYLIDVISQLLSGEADKDLMVVAWVLRHHWRLFHCGLREAWERVAIAAIAPWMIYHNGAPLHDPDLAIVKKRRSELKAGLRYTKPQIYSPAIWDAPHELPILHVDESLAQHWDASNLEKVFASSNARGETHAVVFVHGYQGCSADVRLVKGHLMLLYPYLETLSSKVNEERTNESIFDNGDRLANEVATWLATFTNYKRPLRRLSFVAHSVGNLIVRAALTRPALVPYLEHLWLYLSLAGPHTGLLFNCNAVMDTGVKLAKSFLPGKVLGQLAMSDAAQPRECAIYRLSQMSTFSAFKIVVLVASAQDRYVPRHSSLALHCGAAERDPKRGPPYREMVDSLMRGVGVMSTTALVRVDVDFALKNVHPLSFSKLVGRAAHIAFIENDEYMRLLVWGVLHRLRVFAPDTSAWM